MKKEICEALLTLKESPPPSGEIPLRSYRYSGEPLINQFVVFLKPEATEEGVKFGDVFDVVCSAFEGAKITIGAISVLSGPFLSTNQIMDAHYGVINQISRMGISAISQDAREVLNTAFSSEIQHGAEILGGHQFLERFPSISATGLSVLSDNLGTKKLGSGTYCLSIKAFGQSYLILNPFHPFQLAHYTSPETAIVVFECRSPTSWAHLRHQVAGATNPLNAADGSIRKILLSRKGELGLKEVSQGSNCIHLSAGPIEGMIEVQRFFKKSQTELPAEDTSFGHLLLQKGFTQSDIETLRSNPSFQRDGGSVTAFDLTEDLDSQSAVNRLLELEPATST